MPNSIFVSMVDKRNRENIGVVVIPEVPDDEVLGVLRKGKFFEIPEEHLELQCFVQTEEMRDKRLELNKLCTPMEMIDLGYSTTEM